MLQVAIIGGGLSGLALAHLLYKYGIDFHLYEARERFGGRILSQPADENANFHFDLGPSWIWPDDQPLMAEFIEQQGLATFEQWNQGLSLFQSDHEQPPQSFHDPASYAGAQRLVGGSRVLIDHTLAKLPGDGMSLQHVLSHLEDDGDHVVLQFTNADGETLIQKARQVVIMMPPRLIAQNIAFTPSLNPRLIDAMQDTPTWMAGHAKAVLHYATPFWRQQGMSGSAFANYPGCVLGEIFDSGSADGSTAALGGFFAIPAALREKYRGDLEALIIAQMVGLFGSAAGRPLDIHLYDWCTKGFTATQLDENPPQEHPQYGHRFFQLDHWNDKLYFGGTETATRHGGYLEGALQSANFIAQQIVSSTGASLCQTG